MAVHFGTDGIRGRADETITPQLANRLGRAVAKVFSGQHAFVGYDTRESSPSLAAAALAGLRAGGSTVTNLGVFTTSGVAVMCEQRGGVGVIVSASHNPYFDNGLKVVGPGGSKLDLDTEMALEEALNAVDGESGPFEDIPVDQSAHDDYLSRLQAVLSPGSLQGLRVVLDCANGAASSFAPTLFRALGADVQVMHAAPNGTNINRDCGSTHPESLQNRVRATGSDLGLAFDGDADRLVAIDSHGNVRDGDDLMVIFALDRHDEGRLGGALVVTTMSNLGLRRAMRNARIALIQTDVGDRNVVLALEEHDLQFGGEQSGHLIFRDVLPTGDGMLSGLLLCDVVRRKGRLSQLADEAWQRLPKKLINVPTSLFDAEFVDELYHQHCRDFDVTEGDARLLVRPSGTEPVVRVMIEALDEAMVDSFVQSVRAQFTSPS